MNQRYQNLSSVRDEIEHNNNINPFQVVYPQSLDTTNKRRRYSNARHSRH